VRTFDTLEELQEALRSFRTWYNANGLLQRHGHRTPQEVRADQQTKTLAEAELSVAA